MTLHRRAVSDWLWPLAVFGALAFVPKFGADIPKLFDQPIDSPGTRALPKIQNRPDLVMNAEKLADGFWYLHTQDRSVWTHELQMTPYSTTPNY